jgi:D-alanyl-D-alanine dipeptidase
MDAHPLAGPRTASIPVEDCGEALVDVRTVPSLTTATGPGQAVVRLRTSVVDRLVTAQSLLPRGLRLLVVDGHRRSALLAPAADQGAWPAGAGRHCGAAGRAPHESGAAADVTLCGIDGAALDLGGPVYGGSAGDGGVCRTADASIPAQARSHRRTLGAALEAAGLVNEACSWWHWSYGDAYWALATGAPAATYGPTD